MNTKTGFTTETSTTFAVSIYFPDSSVKVPQELLKWRSKFKQIGNNAFVKRKLKLGDLVDKYGPNTLVTEKLLNSSGAQRCNEKELAEFLAGKEKWNSAFLKVKLAQALGDYKFAQFKIAQAKSDALSSQKYIEAYEGKRDRAYSLMQDLSGETFPNTELPKRAPKAKSK